MDEHEQPRSTSLSSGNASDAAQGRPVHLVTCPFCRSADTEPMSLFGSQLSTAQYYCRACHTPFERMKQEPRPGQ